MKLKFSPRPKPKPETKLKSGGPKPRNTMPQRYVRRNFTLAHTDIAIIQRCAREKGLGERSSSAALRLILREWDQMIKDQHRPIVISLPPEILSDQYLPDSD